MIIIAFVKYSWLVLLIHFGEIGHQKLTIFEVDWLSNSWQNLSFAEPVFVRVEVVLRTVDVALQNKCIHKLIVPTIQRYNLVNRFVEFYWFCRLHQKTKLLSHLQPTVKLIDCKGTSHFNCKYLTSHRQNWCHQQGNSVSLALTRWTKKVLKVHTALMQLRIR